MTLIQTFGILTQFWFRRNLNKKQFAGFLCKKPKKDKNLLMDWILISTIAIFFTIGVYKGFISTFFSFIGSWAVLIVAFLLCGKVAGLLQQTHLFAQTIPRFIENKVEFIVPGEFSNIEELKAAVSNVNGKILPLIVAIFAKNIQIEGQMTAGQILVPPITSVLSKIFAFVILYIALSIFLFALEKVLNKVAKVPIIKGQNRFFGGLFGMARGLALFLVFYGVFAGVGGLFFSKNLISFAKNGVLSRKIYTLISKKIINLFY